MTIKQRKLVLHFLEALEQYFEDEKRDDINPAFIKLFSRKELIDIVLWLYANYDKSLLTEKTDTELLELIATDSSVLAYVIEQWKSNISAVPKLTQDEIHSFFDEIQIDPHYLRDKPVEEWDDYDVSNYYSILFKRGKTKRVFAIFTSDVNDEDKYAVTTKPSFFFDTKAEAEADLKRFCEESNQNPLDFVIHSLWKIN